MQSAFEFNLFAPEAASAATESESWLDRKMTVGETEAGLQLAIANLANVPERYSNLFDVAVHAYYRQFEIERVERNLSGDDEFSIWNPYRYKLDDEKKAIASGLSAAWDFEKQKGVEVFYRENLTFHSATIYVEMVGTLCLTYWTASDSFGMTFQPRRTNRARLGFMDKANRVIYPCEIWAGAYSAPILAEGGGTPNVKTFTHGGKEFTVTSITTACDAAQCVAWSLLPRNCWNKPVYTYKTLREAWDLGEKERGNMTGLQVRVRGIPCVLDGVTIFSSFADAAPFDIKEDEDAPAI